MQTNDYYWEESLQNRNTWIHLTICKLFWSEDLISQQMILRKKEEKMQWNIENTVITFMNELCFDMK